MSQTNVIERYGDILQLQRPVHDGDLFSRRHPRMSRLKRAAIFAPFAALTGLEQRIHSVEIPYEPRRLLSAEEKRRIDRALRQLSARRGMLAEAEYFEVCADSRHPAFGVLGLYQRLRGAVRGVDPIRGVLRLGDTDIAFDDLYRLEPVGAREA